MTASVAPRQPNIANADGGVRIVFGEGTHVPREDGGAVAGFGAARLVADVPNLSLGMRRGPRVAVAAGHVVVAAIGGKQGKGRDGDVLAWSSSDGGQTWRGPVRVNDAAESAREGLHAAAAGTDRTFACAWLDLRSRKTEIRVSTSKDGIDWTPNVASFAGWFSLQCCHPSLAFDGRISTFWRNSLDDFRDITLHIRDGGKSFARRRREQSVGNNACPMDSGAIAVLIASPPHGGAARLDVWRRRRRGSLGEGEQPWIASTAKAASWCGCASFRQLLTIAKSDAGQASWPPRRDPSLRPRTALVQLLPGRNSEQQTGNLVKAVGGQPMTAKSPG